MKENKVETSIFQEEQTVDETKNRVAPTHQSRFDRFKDSNHSVERLQLNNEAYHQFDNWYLGKTLGFITRWFEWALY